MFKRIITILTLAPALGACGATRMYDSALEAPAAESEYAAGLQRGYVDLAGGELDEWDYPDAKHFAKKALAAARAEDVGPDDPQDREIRSELVPKFVSARAEFLNAKAHPASKDVASELATAQVMYDCWLQEQEEDFQADDIAACRDGFDRAMRNVNGAIVAYERQAAAAAQVAPAAAAPTPVPSPGPYVVYFDFDSADLLTDARVVLDRASREILAGKPTTFIVAGHADRAGPDDYNLKLSRQRAEAVVNYLVAQGVPESALAIMPYGEDSPAVKTSDGARNPQNRRVEVTARESERVARQ